MSFARMILTLAALVTIDMLSNQVASAQCGYTPQQLAAWQRELAANQRFLATSCGDPRMASVCAMYRLQVQRIDAILRSCRNQGNTNNRPSDNDCDRLRRQIRQNADQSFQNAMAHLRRIRPGRTGGFVIVYRRLATTHCGDTVRYFNPVMMRVEPWEVQRQITSITNNGGVVLGVSPS